MQEPRLRDSQGGRRDSIDRYELIGQGYAATRREDPRIARRIVGALGDASSVVNVGAGTGSYEPDDRHVIAVEPSDVMAAQRGSHRVPAIRAAADELPLRDASVDAAMAILTLHHWDAAQERGVRELRRVARDRVVILTYDARVSAHMWLIADYLPEVAQLDARIFPPPETLGDWLGGEVQVEPVPMHRDTPDWMLGSFWAHPERALDERARANTSGFARMPDEVVERAVKALRRDLADGSWDARHSELRTLDEYDVGLRLVVAGGTARRR
jgi:SAM-dependent methyltransferase